MPNGDINWIAGFIWSIADHEALGSRRPVDVNGRPREESPTRRKDVKRRTLEQTRSCNLSLPIYKGASRLSQRQNHTLSEFPSRSV